MGVWSGAAFRFPAKVSNRVIKPQALKANDLHKVVSSPCGVGPTTDGMDESMKLQF